MDRYSHPLLNVRRSLRRFLVDTPNLERNLTHLAAGHPMARSHLPELGAHPAAAFDRDRATRMKHATRRRIDRARHLPFHGSEPAAGLATRIRHRHGVEKRPGIRMQRLAEQLVAIRPPDDAAGIQSADVLSQMPDASSAGARD